MKNFILNQHKQDSLDSETGRSNFLLDQTAVADRPLATAARSISYARAIGVLLTVASVVLTGCASNPTQTADECGFFEAAMPAAIQGAVLGAITGGVTRNKSAGVAAGIATASGAYGIEKQNCLRLQDQRRLETQQRAMWEAANRDRQRYEDSRSRREWEQNHRCVTRTVDQFGSRTYDRRDCTFVDYGQSY